ncbi:glutathione S-transferase, partial [Pseudomonas aeruginosa]
MKLHDLDLSGNAYKVRLFLSLIGPDRVKTQQTMTINFRGF